MCTTHEIVTRSSDNTVAAANVMKACKETINNLPNLLLSQGAFADLRDILTELLTERNDLCKKVVELSDELEKTQRHFEDARKSLGCAVTALQRYHQEKYGRMPTPAELARFAASPSVNSPAPRVVPAAPATPAAPKPVPQAQPEQKGLPAPKTRRERIVMNALQTDWCRRFKVASPTRYSLYEEAMMLRYGRRLDCATVAGRLGLHKSTVSKWGAEFAKKYPEVK